MSGAPSTPSAEERAIERALRAVEEQQGPVGGHPAYRSAWRRTALREAVDCGVERR